MIQILFCELCKDGFVYRYGTGSGMARFRVVFVSFSTRCRVVVVVGSKQYANYILLYNKQQGLTSQGLFNEYLLNNETTIHNQARMNEQSI